MTKINDGGPAFPDPWGANELSRDASTGMTLRDWFAGMALQGLLAGRKTVATDYANNYAKAILEDSYKYADAMLKAREASMPLGRLYDQDKEVKL